MILKTAHISMQFGDTDQQMIHDVNKLIDLAIEEDIAWITGTEAGGKKSKPLPALLRRAAAENGFHFHLGRGEWVLVADAVIDGGWKTDYIPVLTAQDGAGKHTDRGVTKVEWDNALLGHITVGVGHYLTDGRRPGTPNYLWNVKYAQTIGELANEAGAGEGLFFYGGDQNINDREDDTFHGQPVTSAADEVGKYENTGHGPIDVMASYDRDKRVKALNFKVWDDREFFLHTDHFLTLAKWEIAELSQIVVPPPPVPVEHVCPMCSNVHLGVIPASTS